MALPLSLLPVQALELHPCSPPTADGVVAHAIVRIPEGSGAGTGTRVVDLKQSWLVEVTFTRGQRAGETMAFRFRDFKAANREHRVWSRVPQAKRGGSYSVSLREALGYSTFEGWVEVLKP